MPERYKFLYFFVIAIFIATITHAQSQQKIDSLIELSVQQTRKQKWLEVANTAYNVVELSQEAGYEKGIVQGLYYVSYTLYIFDEFAKSIEYAQKALVHKAFLEKNPIEELRLMILLSDNQYSLGNNMLTRMYYDKAAKAIIREKRPGILHYGLYILHTAYDNVAESSDSLYYSLVMARQSINHSEYGKGVEHVTDLGLMRDKAFLYQRFANYFFDHDSTDDSARNYFNHSLEIIKNAPLNLYTAYAYDGLGRIEERINNYEKAIQYRLRSLAIFENEGIYLVNLQSSYADLNKLYRKTGDLKNEKKYKTLYDEVTYSIEKQKAEGRDKTILLLVQEKEAELAKSHSTQYKTILLLAGLFLLLATAIFGAFSRYKKQKDFVLVESMRLLDESEKARADGVKLISDLDNKMISFHKELKEKDRETELLKTKVNESFEELLKLAKENHSHFYTRFQEIHPELHQKLLHISNELNVIDFQMSAYIYLGFSTKEIAEYSFKSIRTIQNRKNGLRKRLNIDSEEDLYVWFKQLY